MELVKIKLYGQSYVLCSYLRSLKCMSEREGERGRERERNVDTLYEE